MRASCDNMQLAQMIRRAQPKRDLYRSFDGRYQKDLADVYGFSLTEREVANDTDRPTTSSLAADLRINRRAW